MIVEIDPHSPLPPYEQLRQQIATMIISGTLAPGMRLPPIRQLAADLDLATGTVARAYRELEADRLVVTGGRRGTRVSDPASWSAGIPPAEIERRLHEAAQHYATLTRQLGVSASDALVRVSNALDAGSVHESQPLKGRFAARSSVDDLERDRAADRLREEAR